MTQSRFRIGTTLISITSPKTAIQTIEDAALNGKGGYVCFSNMRTVQYAGKDETYRYLMEHSLMNCADGRPLVWCGKMWGLNQEKSTPGPIVFKRIMENGNKELKHFLLGDTDDVLETLKNKFEGKANIVGAYSPPFAPIESYDFDSITTMIKDSGANVVWTALTAPKQDFLSQKLAAMMPKIPFVAVGRAFRIAIGTVREAPYWAIKLGVAWMFNHRRPLPITIWSITRRFFVLIAYLIRILFRRLRGFKHYE
ncbi:MAG: WecB/TagA/CpsF family glycosyltransferase [Bacteroidaceae bacterium]|nr:WecB/TagA/CpsF family glycosyltransferase [Bacteroidaceae bacterium]